MASDVRLYERYVKHAGPKHVDKCIVCVKKNYMRYQYYCTKRVVVNCTKRYVINCIKRFAIKCGKCVKFTANDPKLISWTFYFQFTVALYLQLSHLSIVIKCISSSTHYEMQLMGVTVNTPGHDLCYHLHARYGARTRFCTNVVGVRLIVHMMV